MLASTDIITQIYVNVDDFVKPIKPKLKKFMISSEETKKKNRPYRLSESEVITIMILFHLSNYRNFKYFYLDYVFNKLKKDFPYLVSYNRFVELQSKYLIYLILFMKISRLSKPTGISFIDSTKIAVCNNRRISSNRVFKGLSARGKTSMGWFYGFKLHLIINEDGEIVNFAFSKGNVADNNEDLVLKLTKFIKGKLFGDKGYLSQKLFEKLYKKGIMLITKIRKNMKNKLMSIEDKILLRKRTIIETVNDELKNILLLEHTRHRSPINAFANCLCALIAYTYLPKKPSIRRYSDMLEAA